MQSAALPELSRALTRGNVLDAGYGIFQKCLRYKLERQGKPLILVDRYAPTTRTCSVCGQVREEVPLTSKVWTCTQCGTVHQKQSNTAQNIKTQGLAQYFNRQAQKESA